MEFETEEQQLDAIKKWWKDNSNMIFASIAIGVSAIFGWQYYQQQTIVHSETASILYEKVANNLENLKTINEQMVTVNTLQAEYSDTPYAGLAALLLAKQQMAAGDFVKAQQQLEWLVTNARQDEVKYLAKIRMARLLLSTNQSDTALAILSETYPDSFKAMVYELKGDLFVIKGDTQQARAAYEQALSVSLEPNRWLQIKLDDLGVVDNNNAALEPSA